VLNMSNYDELARALGEYEALADAVAPVAVLKARIAGWGTMRQRRRRPTLAGALKQASKAGVNVKGATVAADGSVSLQFGEPQTEQINDLDKWMAKRHAN
jgi:hypothetical protein